MTGFNFFNFLNNQKGKPILLVIAFCSIFVSSLSLFVLQAVMNGLQYNLKSRSKHWIGSKVYSFKQQALTHKQVKKVTRLTDKVSFEVNFEGVLDANGVLLPGLFRGIYYSNKDNISSELKDVVLSGQQLIKAGVSEGDKVRLTIPHIVDEFFGDRPRISSLFVSNSFESNVSEVDELHMFVETKNLENITHTIGPNTLRVFGKYDDREIVMLLKSFGVKNLKQNTWEEKNDSLVYALRMEKIMMVFLFSSLSVLISQAISGGFTLLFNRLKFDFASLWVLGLSNKTLFYKSLSSFLFLTLLFCCLGLMGGFLVAVILKNYGSNLMPSIFLETNLPIYITPYSYLISLFVPFSISSLVLFGTIRKIYKSQDQLQIIRSVS